MLRHELFVPRVYLNSPPLSSPVKDPAALDLDPFGVPRYPRNELPKGRRTGKSLDVPEDHKNKRRTIKEGEETRPRSKSASIARKPLPFTPKQSGPVPRALGLSIHIPMSPIMQKSPSTSRQQEQELHLFSGSEDSSHSANQSPTSPNFSNQYSRRRSEESYETKATSIAPPPLPGLQAKAADEEELQPLGQEDLDPASFDLVAPVDGGGRNAYSLETRSEQLFSAEHLKVIFSDPALLLRFTGFLSTNRPKSIPILVYYLDAVKALKALAYSNAIAEALEPLQGHEFSRELANPTSNKALEQKAERAFAALVKDDLPAYVTHVYIQTVSLSISRRICGTLPAHLREASEGLAEVFCLTDPSRPDNPIVFASEEFHRTTQYGMNYVLGRNCRFLQGPKTNPNSITRLRAAIKEGKEICEVFLNYRRDGSPFMNLLMMSPLCDSRGNIRYFIGAQVDVSGLVKSFSDMESLELLAAAQELDHGHGTDNEDLQHKKDELQELSSMLNRQELETVRRWGGRMHRERDDDQDDDNNPSTANWKQSRVLIHDGSPDRISGFEIPRSGAGGKLSGIYENYLLLRPYPSLKILFASPSLRVPGILQSPFLSRIGGSSRVREELSRALADGRGVTAKIRWLTKSDADGRNRWIHCTPLLGGNGAIGVWMIVIVDDEKDITASKRFRQAPPIDPRFGRTLGTGVDNDALSLRDFAGPKGQGLRAASRATSRNGTMNSSILRPGSAYDGSESFNI